MTDHSTSSPGAPDAARAGKDEARVAKVMARAGVCSRRDAEAWIRAGRVAVNGTVIGSPALNVGPDDAVTVDGSPIGRAERTRLFMFHKTRGLVTTEKDPEGRSTIFDALPSDLPRVVTVGRLDINTEGLLLLTNDGGLARVLELPATGWLRRYRVRANGSIDQAALDALAEGVTVDGVDYAGIEAKLDRQQGANVWLTMGLREGKNREIKRVLEHLGLGVNRLIRLSFGPFQLGDLPEGAVEEVKPRVLRDQLGPALAREAGVDFEGPVTAVVVTREVRDAERDERVRKRAKETAPERPRDTRAASAPRPHVSSLRGDRAEAADGPRRKTSRSATEDRRGRAVAVERVTTVGAKPRDLAPNRNARRFERLRGEEERAASPRARPATSPREVGVAAGLRPRRPRPDAGGHRADDEASRSRIPGRSAADRAPERRPRPDTRPPVDERGPRPARSASCPRTSRPCRWAAAWAAWAAVWAFKPFANQRNETAGGKIPAVLL